jgi:uroporphyrinogen decarboxylase
VKEHRFIRALLRQPVDRTPVWIMRQAGRYLPEYREIRHKAKDFLNLCKTPELACLVTLQPLKRFPLDAAIIFSDILTIPDAMGLGLHFEEGEGPRFQHPTRTLRDIENLPTLDPEIELRYVLDAIRLTHHELDQKVPLIGFSGSPWTVATYMVEGQTSKNFSQIKKLLYREPSTAHRLLSHLSLAITDYLNAQILAGCDCVMLFDTWGGILSPSDYIHFSLNYMHDIVKKLIRTHQGKPVPVIIFSKNGGQHLVEIAASGCDAIGVDWMADLKKARQQVGDKVALQGNLDPAVLYADANVIQEEVEKVLQQFGMGSGHIFNLGHGIYPDVDPERVAIMIDAVQSLSPKYHQHPSKVLG